MTWKRVSIALRRNVMILTLVLAAVAVVFVLNRPDDKQISTAPKKDSYAPAFDLSTLDGSSSYHVGGKRDKVLIVNFWASWCGPCELEAPDLRDIYEKHKDKLDLYAVNATKFDKLREAKFFAKEQKFVFPVLTDATGEVGDQYKVFSYPISFIVDRDGLIRERIEGVISRDQWEQYLQEVL